VRFSAKELAHIEQSSTELGALSSDEKRLLMKYSMKMSINDELTIIELQNLEIILSKLCTKETIDQLETRIAPATVKKLRLQCEIKPSKQESIYTSEAETGLLASKIDRDYPVHFSQHHTDSTAFFSIEELAGAIMVSLNANHRLSDEIAEMKKRDYRSYQVIMDILHSWGLFEIDLHSDKELELLIESRELWGRKLRDLLGTRHGGN